MLDRLRFLVTSTGGAESSSQRGPRNSASGAHHRVMLRCYLGKAYCMVRRVPAVKYCSVRMMIIVMSLVPRDQDEHLNVIGVRDNDCRTNVIANLRFAI